MQPMSLRQRSVVLAVLAALLVAAGPAGAVDPNAEAKAAYQRGAALYDQGRYADAVREFNRAWDLSKRPAILYNLARAETRLGHDQDAIDYLRRYLDAAPHSFDAPSVRAEIAALQRALDGAAAKRKAEQEAAEATQRAAAAEARARVLAEDAERERARRPRWAGFALGAGGVALLVGGLAAGLVAEDAARQVSAGGAGGSTKVDKSLQRRGQTAQLAGFVCDGVGAALLAAGVGVLVWSYGGGARSDGQRRAWIAPTGSGVMAGGTF